MAKTIITTREMLNRYETFYFQPRQTPRNICDPASSNHHISGMLHGKNNFSPPYHNLVMQEATTQVWGR